ncbi:MAG: hypothetical protein JPMHGGIA_01761 [Saprospiraceae bacterium]|nr:hypothetical protein [Saprospiraceae bacterium]
MPILETRLFDDGCQIFLWEIAESEPFYLEAMDWTSWGLEALSGAHPFRRRDFLSSRHLMHLATGLTGDDVTKSEEGPWLIKGGGFLSISHSGQWTGLAVSSQPVGFDLQQHSDKLRTIAPRFLDPAEREALGGIDCEDLSDLCLAWAAKEAVYKANAQRGLAFARQIRLEIELGEGEFMIPSASVHANHRVRHFNIKHDKNEDFAWAVAVAG